MVTHRQRIAAIYAGKSADRQGFWLGEPHSDLYPGLLSAVGVRNDEELRRRINDDCRWVAPDWACYKHPEKRPIFDIMHGLGHKTHHGQPGCFADCVDVGEVEKYPWPNAKYLDLNHYRTFFAGKEDCWRMGGTWGHFFHVVMDFFGLENYFMKMYTDPAVVHAVTSHVVDFFLAANERIFTECGDLIDVVFFGNDFGTQEDLFISPEMFKEFVLPYFKQLIEQAKRFNKPVQLHSCGAISRAIPWLIDAGIDGLHPLQARAKRMDACALASQFKGKIVFVGGVDTQDLMCNGTPQQVKDEVKRLRDVFGNRWIISPSHEKLLPEVPIHNIVALCEEATGISLS